MADSMDQVLDVAVVGGGVSGVYSAWRLQAADPGRKIRLFECSKRIGGRLLSVTPPGMPHVHCELGGMRYMSSQPLVRSLVENKLRLATCPQVVSEPENLAYLRGRHLRIAELADPGKLPYQLDWAERGRLPDDLVSYAIEQVIPGVTTLRGDKLMALLKTFKIQGQHVCDHGFWNLLALAMSREAYCLARDAGGYDTTVLNWNAVDTILLNFDFAPGVTFSRLVDGYEQVPARLCAEFQQAGGEVALEQRLASFDRAALPDGSTGVELRFAGRRDPVLARALILAMPRRSLELLDQTGAVLGPANTDVHALIDSVCPIPLFKLFICYDHPWWETVGVKQGRSVTDLPVRQVFYWGVEGRQTGADPRNQSATMMVYDDTLNVDFWAGLRRAEVPRFQSRLNAHGELHPGSERWHDHAAPAQMVDEVHRQMVELHGLRAAPRPYAAAYRDWGEDPYGGGVNFWKIHARSWEVIPAIARPRADVPVYICGEAYSNGQGWVEGALQTAEIVLQDHFHLPPPDWVTAGAS